MQSMSNESNEKKIIGRAEKIELSELGYIGVPARIDTGAKTSAIWASNIREQDGVLTAVLFGEGAEYYTGDTLEFSDYDTTVVASSTGHVQKRYKVRLLVKLKGKKIRAWFTLADRSTQVYPVLIGRNVLLGKFIVDVKKGHSLIDEERKRTESLRANTDEEVA
jgi:hypothetical protein